MPTEETRRKRETESIAEGDGVVHGNGARYTKHLNNGIT